MDVEDLVAMLERELAEARRAAAAAVDRAAALRELRSLALAAGHRYQRPLHSPEDLYDEDDEEARATVAALVARIAGEPVTA